MSLTHADIERQLAEIEFAHQDQLKGMMIHLTNHSPSAELLQIERLQFEKILYSLIENTILHSRGTSLEATIETDEQWFKMSVADNSTIEVFSNKKAGTKFIVFLPSDLEKVLHIL